MKMPNTFPNPHNIKEKFIPYYPIVGTYKELKEKLQKMFSFELKEDYFIKRITQTSNLRLVKELEKWYLIKKDGTFETFLNQKVAEANINKKTRDLFFGTYEDILKLNLIKNNNIIKKRKLK